MKLSVLAAGSLLVLAGCGGHDRTSSRTLPRQIALNWTETGHIHGAYALRFRVRSVRIDAHGWRLRASVQNLGPEPVGISRPSALQKGTPAAWTYFGLVPPNWERRHLIVHADTYRPPLPKQLAPGAAWTGTFGGPGPPQGGARWRAVFGVFIAVAPSSGWPGKEFAWITDHSFPGP